MYPVPNLPLQGSSDFHRFSVALTAVWRARIMVSTCALQNAACGVPPAGVAACAVKFAPGVTMFRAWKQVMKELGQTFGGQKTPKMDRLENPEETVMFWNPTCNFFKLRSSILGDSESARAIANVAGLSMQRGCGLSFLAIDSVAKPAMSGLEGCFFSQYE